MSAPITNSSTPATAPNGLSDIAPAPRARASSSSIGNASADASARLADAIDDFLGDIEKKFKNISDEVMSKLDDMAERCDRLEQEMMMREAGSSNGLDNRPKTDGSVTPGNS